MPTAPSKAAPKKMTARDAVARLKKLATKKQLGELDRYAITATKPLGVTMANVKKVAKECGKDHALAADLWKTGHYEARLLAAFVGEPEKLTVAQMNAWTKDFDNWAIADTVCFHLFDRSPLAWKRLPAWAKAKGEFQRRAAFALLWGLALHDKDAGDAPFLAALPLIERAATDERNFVKKAVDMALRAVGTRNAKLRAAALKVTERLAAQDDPTARWIGRHAGREIEKKKPRG